MESEDSYIDFLPSHKDYLPQYNLEAISDKYMQPQSNHKELLCIICLNLMKDPRTLNCGHTCCYNCLKSWTKTQPNCPTCRTPIFKLKQLKTNVAIKNMIEELPAKCPSELQIENRRCGSELKLKDLEAHSKKCPNILLTCKCDAQLPRGSFLESDQQCLCPERSCEYCQSKFQERLIKFHSDSCKNEKTKCKYCGESYIRKDRIAHESEKCFAPCPYVGYGCKHTKLTPVYLKNHIGKALSDHRLLVLRCVDPQISKMVDELSAEIENIISPLPEYTIRELEFEFSGHKLMTEVVLNDKIQHVVEDVYRALGSSAKCDLEVTRKRTSTLLNLSLTFADYDIQEREVLIIQAKQCPSLNKSSKVLNGRLVE